MLLVWYFFRCLQLSHALADDPKLDEIRGDREQALQHAVAATLAAWPDMDPFFLAAVAGKESHYNSTATSRVDGRTGKRKTGAWPSRQRAPYFVAPYFCGVIQARTLTWSGCLALRPLIPSYRVGADELRYWIRRCKGSVRCVLARHGFVKRVGTKCDQSRRCTRYVDNILKRERALRASVL